MKKVYESKWMDCGNLMNRIHLYEFDNREEWWGFGDMTKEEKLAYCGIAVDYDSLCVNKESLHDYSFGRAHMHLSVDEHIFKH